MTLLKELNQLYEAGEMDGLKSSILPFFRSNKDKLYSFIQMFVEKNGDQPLEFMIKYFILSANMPFNMKFYMNTQSEAMKKDIGPEIDVEEKRTALISDWINKKAAIFREHSIMQQIFCFEQMKDELLPVIREDLCIPTELYQQTV